MQYVEVQPGDGFGTLLPQESLKIDLIFSANKAKEYRFQLCCKTKTNRWAYEHVINGRHNLFHWREPLLVQRFPSAVPGGGCPPSAGTLPLHGQVWAHGDRWPLHRLAVPVQPWNGPRLVQSVESFGNQRHCCGAEAVLLQATQGRSDQRHSPRRQLEARRGRAAGGFSYFYFILSQKLNVEHLKQITWWVLTKRGFYLFDYFLEGFFVLIFQLYNFKIQPGCDSCEYCHCKEKQ